MGVSQIRASFQNDGNFSQLDLRDVSRHGQVMRIETFRCSQPGGGFGVTMAGSSVESIAGNDHLRTASNRTFRHVFSVGDEKAMKGTLEIREMFAEDGSLEVRTRDIDGASSSFGTVLIARATPVLKGINLQYEVRKPDAVSTTVIASPLRSPITKQVSDLPDLGEPSDTLGSVQHPGYFAGSLDWSQNNATVLNELDAFGAAMRTMNPEWTENVRVYERMGDFRDKCIHDGTNLVGPHVALASEYVLIRAYRMSLITLGRIFDVGMSVGADRIDPEEPLVLDTKPGVYSVFLTAYALNIGLYQLGIDKVHSDYGDVPMKLKPGSRLENGARPVVDATNLNRMLALLAAFYYVPAAVHPVATIDPVINTLPIADPALSFAELVTA